MARMSTYSATHPTPASIEYENARWLEAWKARRLKAELLRAARRVASRPEV